MNDEGKTYRTNGKTNEDYYAFGQPLLAPCDAEVVQAVDGVKDNIPGEKNPMFVPGNSVMLKTPNNEFILLAHFKNHSKGKRRGASEAGASAGLLWKFGQLNRAASAFPYREFGGYEYCYRCKMLF